MSRPSLLILITNKLDTTADLIVWRATRRGVGLVRINTEDLPGTEWEIDPLRGTVVFHSDGRSFSSDDVAGVFYRRPEPPSFTREWNLTETESKFLIDQWWELLDTLEVLWSKARWISLPTAIRRAENKPLQLRLAIRAGFSVPSTCVTNSAKAISAFRGVESEVVVKALGGGYLGGEPSRFVFTNSLAADQRLAAQETAACPVVVQRQIVADRHLRITVVGQRVFAAEVQPSSSVLDWRTAEKPPTVKQTVIPERVESAARTLVRNAGLAFSSMDVIQEHGNYFFLDLNPNGEWGWLERGGGIPISEALIKHLMVNGKVQ